MPQSSVSCTLAITHPPLTFSRYLFTCNTPSLGPLCISNRLSTLEVCQGFKHLQEVKLLQVRQLIETLRCNNHQAFPVTPDVRRAFDDAEPFDLHGVVLRADILKLIMHGLGFFELDASGEIPSSRSHIPPTQKVFGF